MSASLALGRPSAGSPLSRADIRAAILARVPDFRPSVRASSMSSASPRSTEWGTEMHKATSATDAKLSARTVGERWALSLARRYRNGERVKRIMADFSAAEGTVKGWLAGQPPQHRHLVRAVELHGAGIVAELYAPESDWQRREQMEQRLAALEAGIRELREAL